MAVRIYFTMAVFASASAGTVSELLRTAHATRKSVIRKNALPAVLASENGFFEGVLGQKKALIQSRMPLGKRGDPFG
jgi:hypothetical protein